MISVFELFSIGIGPSSSHTVGPMRAALRFVTRLAEEGRLAHVAEVRCELFGSLGAIGHGHGSPAAVLLGLAGERPETVDTDAAPTRVREIRGSGRLWLLASTRFPSASPSIWCRTGAVRCRCTPTACCSSPARPTGLRQDRAADQRRDAGQRAVPAHRERGAGRAATDLAG